ncbi:MAG: DUF305 domain-containing protein [Patescibacteria group bacterium]
MKNHIPFLAVALLIGIAIGYVLPNEEAAMHNTMDSMTASLDGKMGDAFDQAFLEEMIVHHEGAVAMAEEALKNAGHEEIKSMATAIISAQTAEIAQMHAWLSEWYGAGH